MRKRSISAAIFIIMISAALFLCAGCSRNLFHFGEKKVQGTSPLTAESGIGEYVLTIPEGKEDHIQSISCSLLMNHPSNKGYYAHLCDLPCKVSQEDGKIHITKNPRVLSVYDNSSQEFTPVSGAEYEKESDTYTLPVKVFDVESAYSDYMLDGSFLCDFILSKSGDDSLSYHIDPHSKAGTCPEWFTHMKEYGRVINAYPQYSKLLRGYNGCLRPYDEWHISGDVVPSSAAFETETGKQIDNGFRFAMVDIHDMKKPITALVSIEYGDGRTLQSDLLPLRRPQPEGQKETYNTEKGKLSFLILDGKAILADYSGHDDTLVIPEEVGSCPVSEIQSYAISGCGELTSLTLPESLITLHDGSVSHCSSLTTVSLPSSLKDFPSNSFLYCENLKEVSFSGDNPYYQINNGLILTSDGKTLVFAAKTLEGHCQIPDGTVEICPFVFNACRHLTSVSFPESLTKIGAYSFYGTGLDSVTLPNHLKYIGADAFSEGQINLKYNDYLISGDTSSEKRVPPATIKIGKEVEMIGEDAFGGFIIEEFSVDSHNLSYSSDKGILYNKDKSVLIACPSVLHDTLTLPEGLVNMDDDAFGQIGLLDKYCQNDRPLTKLVFPESLKYISLNNIPSTLNTIVTGKNIKIWDNIEDYYRIKIEGIEKLDIFSISNGVIYSEDKKTLLCVPFEKTGSLDIEPGTEDIRYYAIHPDSKVTQINIPSKVTLPNLKDEECSAVFHTDSLKEIHVDQENPRFVSRNGVLFDRISNILLSCPENRKELSYEIPEGTVGVASQAFHSSPLTELSIPSSLKYLRSQESNDIFLDHLDALEDLHVAKNNPNFTTTDCLTISNTDKSLIFYNSYNNKETVSVPEGVETVSANVFGDISSNLPEEIIFHEGLKEIEEGNFNYIGQADQWDKIIIHLPDSLKEISEDSFISSSGIELHVGKDSFGARYAKSHDIPYVIIPR